MIFPLSKQRRHIAFQAALVMVLTGVGQLSGLFRDILMGVEFGTSAEFDAYTAIFGFVLFVGSLLSILPNLAIPSLTSLRVSRDQTGFSKRLSSLGVLTLLSVLILIIFGEIWTDTAIAIVAPGLLRQPNSAELSRLLVHIALPICFLLAVVHLLKSLLNLSGRFSMTSLESIFFNTGIITALLFVPSFFAIKDVRVPLFGCYVAYFVYIGVCLYRVRQDITFGFVFDYVDLMGAAKSGSYLLLGTFFAYVSPMVIVWFASFAGEGDISALGYASRTVTLSVGTIVNSAMVVFLPTAALAVVQQNKAQLSRQTEKLLSVCLAVSCSAAFVILMEGGFVVRFLFQRGEFGEQSAAAVVDALKGYIPWMIFFPLSAVATRVLYAHANYGALVKVSLISLPVTLIGAPVFSEIWGVMGLALTASLHMVTYASMLLYKVSESYVELSFWKISKEFFSLLTIFGICAVIANLVKEVGLFGDTINSVLIITSFGSVAMFKINTTFPLLRFAKKM